MYNGFDVGSPSVPMGYVVQPFFPQTQCARDLRGFVQVIAGVGGVGGVGVGGVSVGGGGMGPTPVFVVLFGHGRDRVMVGQQTLYNGDAFGGVVKGHGTPATPVKQKHDVLDSHGWWWYLPQQFYPVQYFSMGQR